MNNECGAQHVSPIGKTYYCNRARHHNGDHYLLGQLGTVLHRWARTPNLAENPSFEHTEGFFKTKPLPFPKGSREVHPSLQGGRYAYVSGRGWGKTYALGELYAAYGIPEDAPKPDETPVLLTLEDLKVISYHLSGIGPEDDDTPTVAKISEALKKML